jgi:hypothetical protein
LLNVHRNATEILHGYRIFVHVLLKKEKIVCRCNFHCQIGNGKQGLQFK